MLKVLLTVTITYSYLCIVRGNYYHDNPKIRQVPAVGEPGQPLILTPLIEAGDIQQARNASRVGSLDQTLDLESYSGFFTVDKKYDSNMFFWYFPAEDGNASAPVILWLQGGPGSSSLFGLFTENGPYIYSLDNQLERRQYSWSNKHHLIYIDNPVGTGFSFTNSSEGYSRNEISVGNNLYEALVQFFTIFSELQGNEFFIAGESYGGKYVPAASYAILKRNPNKEIKINLKGIAIGNGLCDPAHMMLYGDHLYQMGLIDVNAREHFYQVEHLIRQRISEQDWESAMELRLNLLDDYLYNLTDYKYLYNFLYTRNPRRFGDYDIYLQQEETRKAIHVGDSEYHDSDLVAIYLSDDVMQSISPWLVELLANYRVLIYSGQLDLRISYTLTLGYLQALEWDGAQEYRTADRYQWHVGTDLAGFVKTAANLTEVLVRNSGHMVPTDQPEWAYTLISKFVRDQSLH
uniref:Carboxypeptidase n=1 Tax=Timema tahoe TaxID=61484 RepID=A0A7R9IP25_9NEOP|nr:unnamed protein product [Timema tahoe]